MAAGVVMAEVAVAVVVVVVTDYPVQFYNQVLMRTFASFSKIYMPPLHSHFKKQRGPSAGSSFEQISMQRLTGVPSPISGGTG